MTKKINTEKELLVFITITSNYFISLKSDNFHSIDASDRCKAHFPAECDIKFR
jgi:hypothetical protein